VTDAGPQNGGRPRLTVVSVTLRDPRGLRFTLASLQPLLTGWEPGAWEHVIVDGSPADTRSALDGLTPAWPLVHVEAPPRGVPDAFNRALEVAAGTHIWFLNGGDGLRDAAALSRMLGLLESRAAPDLVGAGAYLHRSGVPLYSALPRRSLLGNLVGRSWIYHQAVIYRRASLRTIGPFSTSYRVAADYDYHLRCYVGGLRAVFTRDVLVDYDMGGGSNDAVTAFREFRRIQRSHRRSLPAWVGGANEIVRGLEYARILGLRTISTTRLGAPLRPVWARANRWMRDTARR
jgi:hypothetical protein